MKSLFLPIVSVTLIVSSCQSELTPLNAPQNESKTTTSVIQPIAGLEIENRTYLVDSGKDEIIKLPNGGSIELKANSFEDENGEPVKGKVEIQWKEYHSLTDIMLSGIPMKYDSAGVNYDFVSGGMFTIDALIEGKKVDLKEGKTAKVNLASYVDTPCFNFYELDEKTGDWSYETTKSGTIVESEIKSKTEGVKNQGDILDVRVDISSFPSLQKRQVVAWKAKEKLSNLTKQQLKNELCETQLEQSDDGDYKLFIKNVKQNVVIDVEPVTMATVQAQKRELLGLMEAENKELLEFQNNYQAGKIVRSIEIPGMGTYNWDKVLERDMQRQLAATFELKKDVNPEYVSIFFISPKENVVVNCDVRGDKKLNFDATLPNYLVAILPDNSILMVDAKEFAKAGKAKPGSAYEFVFSDIHRKVETSFELAELLQGIISSKS